MVRVADVQRNPATVTQSVGPKVAVCTTNGVMTPRALRGTVNSTASSRQRSKRCSRAAASWLTAAAGPRLSRPTRRERSTVTADPDTT